MSRRYPNHCWYSFKSNEIKAAKAIADNKLLEEIRNLDREMEKDYSKLAYGKCVSLKEMSPEKQEEMKRLYGNKK